MKKFIKTSLLLTTLLTAPLVSCYKNNEDNKNNKTEVAKVEVTGVSLDQASKSLGVGEEFTLKATIAPENATNKDVTWSSTNPEVATVDSNGKVKAMSVGKAEIVAKSNNGKEAKCSINVWGLELRIRTEEGEEAYTDFNIADFKNQQIEYKIHKEDGSVTAEWTLVNYDQHYSSALLNSDKSKITLFFDIAEEVGEGEETSTEEPKKYSGSITLNNPTRTKEVSEVDATKYSTKKVVNEETGEEEEVQDTSLYFVRGIYIGKAYRSYTNTVSPSIPEVFVKDLNSNAIVGIRTETSNLIGSFEKGDEIISLVQEKVISTADSSVKGNIYLYSTNQITMKLSSENNYQVDLSQATILDTASKVADLFQTVEKRKPNLFKLFTIPKGNKYSNASLSNGQTNLSLFFGLGYTSDGREGYTDYAYYRSATGYQNIKVRNSLDDSDKVFSFYYDQACSNYSLGSSDAAVKLLYPSRFAEGYTGSISQINGQNGCSVTNNNKDGMSSEKDLTFIFLGGAAYDLQPIAILDSSWIHD